MSAHGPNDADMGKIVETTKKLAATKQIHGAVSHFWNDEYECAITLAAAAEGLLPATDRPHLFSILRASPAFKDLDANLFINWLKHPVDPNDAVISEFEVAMIIVRAISKFIAVFGVEAGTGEMKKLVAYVFARGHLRVPDSL
jgi:hypothetical protein